PEPLTARASPRHVIGPRSLRLAYRVERHEPHDRGVAAAGQRLEAPGERPRGERSLGLVGRTLTPARALTEA
ncbi:unnamed protein product, partial [Ectocarpus sp. 12 AP-2014]